MSTFDPTLPTRGEAAFPFRFDGAVNINDEGVNDGLVAHIAPISRPDGSIAHWLTRVESLQTYTLLASQCLEFSLQPQSENIIAQHEMRTRGNAPSHRVHNQSSRFWPCVSNEFMARCFCGSLDGARQLFDAIERALSTDSPLSLMLGECLDEQPLQSMLFEFEAEGLGMVHMVYNYDWTDPGFSALEESLRLDPLSGFDQMPWIYDSQDYHGTYDDYCSNNFIDSTSPEFALAAWKHVVNQESLQTFLTGNDSFSRMQTILTVAADRLAIESTVSPVDESRPALRV